MYAIYCRLNVHVGASNMDVIRAARGRLKPKARRARAMRIERHKFYRAMLAEHQDARELYLDVTRGRLA